MRNEKQQLSDPAKRASASLGQSVEACPDLIRRPHKIYLTEAELWEVLGKMPAGANFSTWLREHLLNTGNRRRQISTQSAATFLVAQHFAYVAQCMEHICRVLDDEGGSFDVAVLMARLEEVGVQEQLIFSKLDQVRGHE